MSCTVYISYISYMLSLVINTIIYQYHIRKLILITAIINLYYVPKTWYRIMPVS